MGEIIIARLCIAPCVNAEPSFSTLAKLRHDKQYVPRFNIGSTAASDLTGPNASCQTVPEIYMSSLERIAYQLGLTVYYAVA